MNQPPLSNLKPTMSDRISFGLCVAVILLFMSLPLVQAEEWCTAIYMLAGAWNDNTGYTHGWFIIPAAICINKTGPAN